MYCNTKHFNSIGDFSVEFEPQLSSHHVQHKMHTFLGGALLNISTAEAGSIAFDEALRFLRQSRTLTFLLYFLPWSQNL